MIVMREMFELEFGEARAAAAFGEEARPREIFNRVVPD